MSEPPWLPEAMAKYKRKLSHVKLRPQLRSLIPTILDKTAVTQAMMCRIKTKVKLVLDAEGVRSDFHPAYYAYSYALDKSQRTMEFMVDRIREHNILRSRWEGRGLEPDILDKIDALLIFAK